NLAVGSRGDRPGLHRRRNVGARDRTRPIIPCAGLGLARAWPRLLVDPVQDLAACGDLAANAELGNPYSAHPDLHRHNLLFRGVVPVPGRNARPGSFHPGAGRRWTRRDLLHALLDRKPARRRHVTKVRCGTLRPERRTRRAVLAATPRPTIRRAMGATWG